MAKPVTVLAYCIRFKLGALVSMHALVYDDNGYLCHVLGVAAHINHSMRILCGAEHVRDSLGLTQELVLHVVLLLALSRKRHVQLCKSPRLLEAFQL